MTIQTTAISIKQNHPNVTSTTAIQLSVCNTCLPGLGIFFFKFMKISIRQLLFDYHGEGVLPRPMCERQWYTFVRNNNTVAFGCFINDRIIGLISQENVASSC